MLTSYVILNMRLNYNRKGNIAHIMLIGYRDKKVQELCENERIAQKKLDKKVAKSLMKQLQNLRSVDNLDIFNQTYRSLRIHKLKGKYSNMYALDLTERYRLIFYPCNKNGELIEDDFKFITIITVEEVSNHYDT